MGGPCLRQVQKISNLLNNQLRRLKSVIHKKTAVFGLNSKHNCGGFALLAHKHPPKRKAAPLTRRRHLQLTRIEP